jgi:hypothetical protein
MLQELSNRLYWLKYVDVVGVVKADCNCGHFVLSESGFFYLFGV